MRTYCSPRSTLMVSAIVLLGGCATGSDLYVGAPHYREQVGGRLLDVGAVFRFRGTQPRFEWPGSPPPPIVEGPVQKVGSMGDKQDLELFGWAGVSAKFEGSTSGTALVVGVPGRSVSGSNRPGVLNHFRPSQDGGVEPFAVMEIGRDVTGRPRQGGLPGVLGWSLAVLDLNGNGRHYVLAGAPGQPVGREGPIEGSGAVYLYRRTPLQGPVGDSWQVVQIPNPVPRQTGDWFGEAVAAFDFDNDGVGDFAVGAPHKDSGDGARNGVVLLFKGVSGEVGQPLAAGNLSQAGFQIGEARKGFGHAIVAGDFDGDGFVDLAVGAYDSRSGSSQPGGVFLFKGTATGFRPDRVLTAATFGRDDSGAGFGYSMAVGDFNGDGIMDLAVGAVEGIRMQTAPIGPAGLRCELAPGRTPFDPQSPLPADPTLPGDKEHAAYRECQRLVEGNPQLRMSAAIRTGRVHILYGSTLGLQPALSPDAAIPWKDGAPAGGEEIGAALSAQDFNGDGIDDLAVGAPGKVPSSGGADAGSVIVFRGSCQGLRFVQELGPPPLGNGRNTTSAAERRRSDRFGQMLGQYPTRSRSVPRCQ